MGQGLGVLDCLAGVVGNGQTVEVGSRRFSIRKRLATGGFSNVDLVCDVQTKDMYAMKRMLCTEKAEVQRAKAEVEYYRLFDHPNIIQVVESGVLSLRRNQGAPSQEVVCVFPLYERGTLLDYVAHVHEQGGYLPEHELLTLFKGICLALDQMHTRVEPLCHRDIKPGNVLLARDGTPVLMDFGSVEKGVIDVASRKEAIAQQDIASERTTLPFRPPELVDVPSRCTLTTAIDIWSLGCTLYSMAYLDTPFEHLNAQGASLPLAIAQGKVSFPTNDPYTQRVRDLILSMIQVDPSQRPTIAQVLERTTEALQAL
ncbi:NAK/MPSK protein kinase [Salpingoeca rosetta]|uniref:non-specific serine/threonine protein kinase n=1 Tax=Salpingoeca rosetta (strain ATCC 50818 / BSB-021) TaxID=946362 RepID=F2TZK9_SALR5|nr:NAK/MPSK protein kinase [Salpingoeca rosetta]EGD79033.1 NAK/MPSK protein kinase [Salpingoeca rosetta]|eukprot:XP_004997989.1 NAK/MPSK protein kinase [Salpingoeca rosetta]